MQQIYRGTPMPKCDFNKVAFNNSLKFVCINTEPVSGQFYGANEFFNGIFCHTGSVIIRKI